MIDDVFREQVALRPREAMSHFEMVDPGVWRVDRAGVLFGLGNDWSGPFHFRLDGVDYEAFGLKDRLRASQRLFLEDVGIVVAQRGRLSKKVLRRTMIGVLGGLTVLAVILLCVRQERPADVANKSDPGVLDELFAWAETRRLRDRQANEIQMAHKVSGQQQPVSARSASVSGLKERARAAFQAGKWAEAIPLVDQLTEETVDADLMYYIGIAYKEGYAVEHDFAEALYWFEKSASGGHAAAQYEMGLANEKGNGIAKNESEAARWYRIAAGRGNAMANMAMGILCEEGRGVERNASEAAKFYRRGSELGNAHAGYLLGKLYEAGSGVPQSLPEAAGCYRRAGAAGHARAGYLLGTMYEEGRGVTRNSGEALYWYEKAGKLGNSAAMSAWQRLRGTNKQWLHQEQ